MKFETFSQLIHSPWSSAIIITEVSWLLWQRLNVPAEARWNHEYTLPDEAYRRRPGVLARVALLGILAAVVLLNILLIPEGVPHLISSISTTITERGLLHFLTSSSFLISVVGFMAELYLVTAFLLSLPLAQAAPEIPDWIKKLMEPIILVLIVLCNFAWELTSIPGGPLVIIVCLLASAGLILAAFWSWWLSFPNSPTRQWFCENFAANHLAPFAWLFGSILSCLEWGWVWWWELQVAVFYFFWKFVVSIWEFITTVITETFTYVKKSFKWVETTITNSNLPKWLKAAANFVAEAVLVLVEVLEVVVEVVTRTIVIPTLVLIMIVWLLVALWIVIFMIMLKLVCVTWAVVVIWIALLLVWLWLIPVFLLRILFVN